MVPWLEHSKIDSNNNFKNYANPFPFKVHHGHHESAPPMFRHFAFDLGTNVKWTYKYKFGKKNSGMQLEE